MLITSVLIPQKTSQVIIGVLGIVNKVQFDPVYIGCGTQHTHLSEFGALQSPSTKSLVSSSGLILYPSPHEIIGLILTPFITTQ